MRDDPTAPTPTPFYGFDLPRQNWFKMPNDWTDITAEISSIAELKVVEYVLKHTWGYQEYGKRKRITNDEFMHGRRRKDGTRIDKGTGLSKPSVIAGLKSAVERGLLIEEVDDSDMGRVKKYYSLRMQEGLSDEIEVVDDGPPGLSDGERGRELGVKNLYPSVKDLNAGVKKFDPGVKKFDPRGKESLPRTEKETIERNLEQETSNNNNSAAEPDDTKIVVVTLTQQGIAEKVARQLAKQYSQDHILEKIEYLDYLQEYDPEKVKNPQGWLRKAIEEDYAAPDGYKSAAERLADAAEEERQQLAAAAYDQLMQARQAEQEAQVATWRQQLHEQYGTTAEDLAFWEKAQQEIKFSGVSHLDLKTLLAGAEILKCNGTTVQIGIPQEASFRQLGHPGTRKVIQRMLTQAAGQSVEPEFMLLAEPVEANSTRAIVD